MSNQITIYTLGKQKIPIVKKNKKTIETENTLSSVRCGKYIGEHKNGYAHGKGKIYDYSGKKMVINGEWKQGYLIKGKEFSPFSGELLYNGEFSKNGRSMDGEGIRYYSNGKKEYKGNFKNDNYNGHGTSYFPNGKKEYEGNWEDNERHGHGTSYYENGKREYEGIWENNKKNGFGTSYDDTGKKEYTGNWTFGKKGNALVVPMAKYNAPFSRSPKITTINFNLRDIDFRSEYLAYVPLNIINCKKWCQFKYQQSKKIMQETDSVLPIRIHRNDAYGHWNGIYGMTDGNHRCAIAREMGYTYIPAIMKKADGLDNRIIKIIVHPRDLKQQQQQQQQQQQDQQQIEYYKEKDRTVYWSNFYLDDILDDITEEKLKHPSIHSLKKHNKIRKLHMRNIWVGSTVQTLNKIPQIWIDKQVEYWLNLPLLDKLYLYSYTSYGDKLLNKFLNKGFVQIQSNEELKRGDYMPFLYPVFIDYYKTSHRNFTLKWNNYPNYNDFNIFIKNVNIREINEIINFIMSIYVRKLITIIRNSPPLDDIIMVLRGSRDKLEYNGRWRGFTSTSICLKSAVHFYGPTNGSLDIYFLHPKVECIPIFWTQNSNEFEILLSPDCCKYIKLETTLTKKQQHFIDKSKIFRQQLYKQSKKNLRFYNVENKYN